MIILSCKEYNKQQTAKWEKDWDKCLKDPNRHHSELPQLAFYIFNKNYGYVAHDDVINTALWAKSKKDVIQRWEDMLFRKQQIQHKNV